MTIAVAYPRRERRPSQQASMLTTSNRRVRALNFARRDLLALGIFWAVLLDQASTARSVGRIRDFAQQHAIHSCAAHVSRRVGSTCTRRSHLQ